MSGIGIFAGIADEINAEMITSFASKLNEIIDFARPIGVFSVSIFVTFYGYMILTGKIQAPAKEFLWRIGIIAFVFAVAFNPDSYEKYVKSPIIYTTTKIASITSEDSRNRDKNNIWNGTLVSLLTTKVNVGASNEALRVNNMQYYEGLDIVFESVSIITSGMLMAIETFKAYVPIEDPTTGKETKEEKESSIVAAKEKAAQLNDALNMGQLLTVGVIGTILTGSVMVYVTGGMLLLLNHVFLIVMLTIGPMFLCLSAFKTTREYAKKWAVKTFTIGLTLALVMSALGFVLNMQGSVSSQLCGVVGALQNQMIKQNTKADPAQKAYMVEQVAKVEGVVTERLKTLGKLGVGANLTLANKILAGCGKTLADSKKDGNGTNLLFVSMQYLVLCIIFSRLITEMANLASAIIGASGMNGSASEVSGSVQGTMNRGAAKNSGKGSKQGGNLNV